MRAGVRDAIPLFPKRDFASDSFNPYFANLGIAMRTNSHMVNPSVSGCVNNYQCNSVGIYRQLIDKNR